MKRFIGSAFFLLLCSLPSLGAAIPSGAPPILAEAQGRISQALAEMDSRVELAARALEAPELSIREKRKVLKDLCAGVAFSTDCSLVDRRGKMRLVEPEAFRSHEGADISGQEQIRRLQQTGKPVLSRLFRAVEGFDALDLEHPIFDASGACLGSVSLLFDPAKFLQPLMMQAPPGEGWEIWVMEPTGRALFGSSFADRGGIFKDERCLQLDQTAALAERISKEGSGSGAFLVPREGGEAEGRRVFWTSASLHGTPLRILATSPVELALGAAPAGKILDMTFPYDENTIYWPTNNSFQMKRMAWGETEAGYWYASHDYSASEHGGTHVDAPLHFGKGGRTVGQVPLSEWIGPAAKVDVSKKCAADRDYQLSVQDVLDWEKVHGPLPAHAWVVMYTGLETRSYPDREKILGTSLAGKEAVTHLRFPGFSPEAAAFLVRERDIAGIALDTPSIDPGPSKDFMVHRIICESDKLGLENLARADRLPEKGATLYVVPMLIGEGTGAPARVFAVLP